MQQKFNGSIAVHRPTFVSYNGSWRNLGSAEVGRKSGRYNLEIERRRGIGVCRCGKNIFSSSLEHSWELLIVVCYDSLSMNIRSCIAKWGEKMISVE